MRELACLFVRPRIDAAQSPLVCTDLWPIVHRERAALVADLKTLPDTSAWDLPSLCAGWTIRDTLAHMTATATTTPPGFVAGLAKARFSFSRFVQAGIARERGADAQETLSRFGAAIGSTSAPPGPKTSWLGEVIIHAEDIRRPLSIEHDYDAGALVAVADFYKNSNTLIGAKSRIADLSLHATEAAWSHGSGARVEGPLLALVLAMTGAQGLPRRPHRGRRGDLALSRLTLAATGGG